MDKSQVLRTKGLQVTRGTAFHNGLRPRTAPLAIVCRSITKIRGKGETRRVNTSNSYLTRDRQIWGTLMKQSNVALSPLQLRGQLCLGQTLRFPFICSSTTPALSREEMPLGDRLRVVHAISGQEDSGKYGKAFVACTFIEPSLLLIPSFSSILQTFVLCIRETLRAFGTPKIPSSIHAILLIRSKSLFDNEAYFQGDIGGQCLCKNNECLIIRCR